MADTVSMKDFLLQFYMQRRFNNMPPEVYAKFEEFLKGNAGKGDFRGHMGDWKKKLMHEQPANSGKFVQNDLPDPNVDPWRLSDAEWEKLYNAFRDAFRSMSANQDEFQENTAAKEFFAEYFGDSSTHTFSSAIASTDAVAEINKLLQVLKSDSSIELLIKDSLGDVSFGDFKSALGSGKYNKETKYQKTLQSVARELKYLKLYEPDKFVAFQNAGIDLDKIENAFSEPHPDARQLNDFKDKFQQILIAVEKKEINDIFRNHDGRKITGQIDAAKTQVAYDDKENDDYIPPKRADEITPLQRMRDFVGETWDDVLGKYLSAHGNRVYFSPAAKQIVAAIDKAKIKPADGITKVLESEGDIKKALQYKSPTATKHFEWFAKTLKEMKDTMPKAFAGALKNGRQMRAIVAETIMKAVRDGKVDEAKTALEVLSVIKYGYTTSKIMDAMRKEELKIFSDGGLSWNKNRGMQFVTNALDKSIKAAFIGVGYGVAIAGNALRLNGSKFNGKRGRLKKVQEEWAAQNAASKVAAETNRTMANAADIAVRGTYEAELNRLNSGAQPINAGNLTTHEADIERRKSRAASRRAALDRVKSSARYQNAEAYVDQIAQLDTQLSEMTDEVNALTAERDAIQAQLQSLRTGGMTNPADFALALSLQQQYDAKDNEVTTRNNNIARMSAQYQTATGQAWRAGLNGAHGAQYSNSKRLLDYVQQQEIQYQDFVDDTAIIEDRVARFKDARDTVEELGNRIDKRNQEMDSWDDKHKDQYMELMAYWDMLETGRDSHTGKMYKWGLLRSNKHSQQKFDAKKDRIINNYVTGYQYAA